MMVIIFYSGIGAGCHLSHLSLLLEDQYKGFARHFESLASTNKQGMQ
jgi:hypothetical protein